MQSLTRLFICAAILLSPFASAENTLEKAGDDLLDYVQGVPLEVAHNPLTQKVASSLKVSDKQAAGGIGALLAMAYQTLDAKQSAELLNMVPHINQLTAMIPGNYGSNISNLSTLSAIFSVIGLSPQMIQQYSKVIRDFLKTKGASDALLNGLTKTWAY